MSKRFPLPAFDYGRYKNRSWTPPTILSADLEARRYVTAKTDGPVTVGCDPVAVSPAFCERFKLEGDHRHALMCILPRQGITLVGRSHAWAIQLALVVDSLDASSANVLFEWKTPRPMNTRLGPEAGASFEARVCYVVCAHRYADRWLFNRTQIETDNGSGAPGFTILSASDDEIDDFHACNLSFTWS